MEVLVIIYLKEIILITGANGHLAQMLGNYLKDEYEVRYLSRKKNNLPSYYYWNIDEKVIEINALKGCSHIIHLAGYPILNKWTVKNKELMYNSRVNSSKLLFDKLFSVIFFVKRILLISSLFNRFFSTKIPYLLNVNIKTLLVFNTFLPNLW